MGRVAVAFAAVALASAAAASGAAASSLEGERFINSDQFQLTSFQCTEAGGGVTFTAGGEAIGPFPGTYQATVTVQSGPLALIGGYLRGEVVSFTEAYEITSGGTTIRGAKTGTAGGQFACRTYQSAECLAIEAFAIGGADYTAAIGARSDFGTANYNVSIGDGETAFDCAGELAVFGAGFTQEFVDSLAPPPAPASADDCKDDGWRGYAEMFRNQGECVSFVQSRAGR